MDKTNKTILAMITIIIILLAILSAIIIYTPGKNDKQYNVEIGKTELDEEILDECTDEYEQMEKDSVVTTSKQEKISPNCLLILTKFYKECNDEIKEYVQVPDNLVNCTEEEVQKQYKDWEIKEFSADKVELYKIIEGECGEHYVLRPKEGKVNIYKVLQNGEESLYEKTDIAIDYLPIKDKENIQNGLKINGKEKLNEIIESFE